MKEVQLGTAFLENNRNEREKGWAGWTLKSELAMVSV